MPQVIKLLNVLQAYSAARLPNSAKRATNGVFNHSVIFKKKKKSTSVFKWYNTSTYFLDGPLVLLYIHVIGLSFLFSYVLLLNRGVLSVVGFVYTKSPPPVSCPALEKRQSPLQASVPQSNSRVTDGP